MRTAHRRVASAALLLLISGFAISAQNPKHAAQLKTVRGVVTDKSDNLMQSAVVFLKDTRTNQVRSNITSDQGIYRFSGLDPNSEYELYAEKDGAKSQTRTLSSFDSRLDIVLNLKLERKKS